MNALAWVLLAYLPLLVYVVVALWVERRLPPYPLKRVSAYRGSHRGRLNP